MVIIFRFGSERFRNFTKVTWSGSPKSNTGFLIARLALLLEFLFCFIYFVLVSHRQFQRPSYPELLSL